MSYTVLKPLKTLKPSNIISLDTEQNDRAEPFVFCVQGYYKGKRVDKVFDGDNAAEKCYNYLFERRWYSSILTGNNLLFDINHLPHKFEVISSIGNFITLKYPKEHSTKYKRALPQVIELNNFYPGQQLLKIVQDKTGEYTKDYLSFCKIWGCDPYIDKHLIGVDGDAGTLTKACKSHCWAAVFAMQDMENHIQFFKSNIQITPALTAQTLHRRRFLPKDCQIFDFNKKLDHDAKIFQSEAYYGGRTDSFIRGDRKDVIGIDINSSYPYSMSKLILPDVESWREEEVSLNRLRWLLKNKEGVARVQVEAPNLKIPYLPHLDQKNGKLIFPTGVWVDTYTFLDLRKALEHGYKIKDVYKCGWCNPQKQNIYKEYVDALYPLKSDPKFKPVVKLLLNSAYGKWGQKANEKTGWQPVEAEDLINLDQNKDYKTDKHGVFYEFLPESPINDRGFAPKAYPILAAYITAHARKTLFDAMIAIGEEHIYYCDTDSIYAGSEPTHQAIERGLIPCDPALLGAWDIEHDNARLQVRGLKYYRIKDPGADWSYRIKGVPGKYQKHHWYHRKSTTVRVVKRASSFRQNKKINFFFSQTREDSTELSEKRFFHKNGESQPLKLLGGL